MNRATILRSVVAAVALALVAWVGGPAQANGTFKLFNGTNFSGTEVDYSCSPDLQYTVRIAVKSLKNNCSYRLWLRENSGGTSGFAHCYDPGEWVPNVAVTYQHPGYVYVGTSMANCA